MEHNLSKESEGKNYREFAKRHKCISCFFRDRRVKCFANGICMIERNQQFVHHENKPICPIDNEGTCPYGNEVGTCFGFCMKEIVREHRERKRQNEQTKEEKEDG